ncbi:GDYXXLXY domain-containing protein [Paraglaciecola hydrolytica]|uniref:GDYXXLXY domain-containing protein n=1 Tax=Paraglaciecola hydrolytica TaxID=1799789 RepID=A0A136A4M4_9ALTE|nr:GDYXXLXY domain-containing protein [Paraglaciecola hydrolytica]KXI30070.1 hypothetical protein AX660_08700 [Paraglaciecola hydrolytica]
MNKIIAIVGLLLALGLINGSIYVKEQHLAQGEVVKLKLAPVDPRSLMQGDYMALRFELADDIDSALPEAESHSFLATNSKRSEGKVIVQLDEQGRASFVALDNGQTITVKQRKLQYRVRDGRVKFATNAFFFAEGSAQIYEAAEYGEFRVNQQGEVLLVALYNQDMQILGAQH